MDRILCARAGRDDCTRRRRHVPYMRIYDEMRSASSPASSPLTHLSAHVDISYQINSPQQDSCEGRNMESARSKGTSTGSV